MGRVGRRLSLVLVFGVGGIIVRWRVEVGLGGEVKLCSSMRLRSLWDSFGERLGRSWEDKCGF